MPKSNMPSRISGVPLNWLWGFPGGSVGKESACNAGDPGLIPGWGRTPGEGKGNPLQYSCLENSTDRGASRATVHGVAKESSKTQWLNHHHQSDPEINVEAKPMVPGRSLKHRKEWRPQCIETHQICINQWEQDDTVKQPQPSRGASLFWKLKNLQAEHLSFSSAESLLILPAT